VGPDGLRGRSMAAPHSMLILGRAAAIITLPITCDTVPGATMPRIKVLEITEAAAGGVLRHLLQIAEHIDKDAFDLTAAVSLTRMADPERDLGRLRSLGIRVEIVPMARPPAPVSDFIALRRLVRLMRRDRYDVVHAHSSKAGFLGRVAARRAGIGRVFYTPHAFALQCGGVRGRLYEMLERIGASFGGTILAVSESERRLAVACGIARAGRVQTLVNAVEASPPPTPDERARARAELGLSADAVVVGTVGRAARQKGWTHLVRAAKRTCCERDDVRFLLIGSGRDAGRVGALARRLGVADKIILAGDRDDAAQLCAGIDVYVQPSLWEGLPYALLDAMARALPVVATHVPGNNDVVEDGVTGLLVPPRDPAAMAAAVLSLLGDPETGRRLGASARDLVLREHNVADFIRRIEEFYRAG